jgi:hypothetical protein
MAGAESVECCARLLEPKYSACVMPRRVLCEQTLCTSALAGAAIGHGQVGGETAGLWSAQGLIASERRARS